MKILYVTTISNTVNAFLIPHIKMLINQGHQVDVAFNILQEVNPEITKMGCKVHILEFQRSPFKKDNYKAYRNFKELMQKERYGLVHTHTPIASLIVRAVCKNVKDVKVIYTAHGFHFYKGAPIKNWVLYYPTERWLARYTDVLITINKEDYKRAKKSFKAGRIEYIPGIGLDTKKFTDVTIDKLQKRKEIGVPNDAFVILSVGELNENKNHETVIKAIAKLNNPIVYYVICGQGSLENYLRVLLKNLGLEKRVKLLGFRKDIMEICKAADVFAFPSFREGLSVSLMEAMAAGLPVVCSNIRGNNDLIEHEKGGYLAKADDVKAYGSNLQALIYNNAVCSQMGFYNKRKVQQYDLETVMQQMKKIYTFLLKGLHIGEKENSPGS